MQGNGMDGQWTPEQAAQWQAMQSMTPEQAAQWQAMQGMAGATTQSWQAVTPEQAAQWQAMQSMAGVATQSWQAVTPEQAAQWQAMQSMAGVATQSWQAVTPEQAAQWQAMQGMAGAATQSWQAVTPEQAAQWQAMQGMTGATQQRQAITPEQLAQWQAAQQSAQQRQPAQWGSQPNASAPAQQNMTEEQWAQWQAAQLGMSPQQLLEWQALQKAKAAVKAKKEKKQRRKEKRKKRGKLVRILQAVAIVAILGGAALFFLNDMRGSGAATAVIEQGTLGTIYRGDAMIVRDETVYNDEGVQSIEYKAQEGSVVYRGNVVCYVYSTGYSSKEMTTLQDYRDQIKDYQETLLAGETAYDQKMSRLETEVVQRGLEVRSLVQGSRGNLINQETILETAIDQRQKYFRSKYSSDMRLNRLFDDEETQQQRIDSWIKQRAATQESIISFYTDGYEFALTPDKFQTYTPAEVRAMFNGQKPDVASSERGKTDIYRLVKKNNYAVLMLIKDSVWTPVEGTTYKLMLEQFSNTTVDAQVLSYTRASGELLLRLAVMGDVTPVLYMRTCEAELGEYADGLMVPSTAIYTQNEQKGVVRINDDGSQVFIPVDVVAKQGDKVFISAIQTGILGKGQTVRLFH
ncbi:MAG TPA: HlyD family efflux transporter periplasmic adaptor subunit [Candidatus Limiplasma sp.]|nr:HlyD family efflux transporter periplasmic adaptor subunit [Candidatus Limiplasma sp.]